MFEGQFACSLFSAGKSDAVLGRFPGSEVAAIAANRFTFPSSSLSGTSKRISSLQWRDRAGVAPASLLSPLWAPENIKELTQRAEPVKYGSRRGSRRARRPTGL